MTACRTLLALAAILAVGAGPALARSHAGRRAGPGGPSPRQGLRVEGRWLEKHLADADLIVLHVAKDPAGYARGHVPGARFLPADELVSTRDGLPNEMPPLEALTRLARRLGLERGKRIVAYDEDNGLLAARAFVVLDYIGLAERAGLLDGQLAIWKREGRPVATATSAAGASSVVPHLDPKVLVDLRTVRDLVWQLNAMPGLSLALIDARPVEGYAGVEPGEGISRPGHIAGAVNVPWEQHLRGPEDPRLRSLAELRGLYASLVPAGRGPVVTYCRTGIQASHSYYVLKYLGYDPMLFDGSYFAWSARSDTPIALGLAAH